MKEDLYRTIKLLFQLVVIFFCMVEYKYLNTLVQYLSFLLNFFIELLQEIEVNLHLNESGFHKS